jgi:hypothetical protein
MVDDEKGRSGKAVCRIALTAVFLLHQSIKTHLTTQS